MGAAFDLSAVPMVLVDDALLIVEANAAAAVMLGVDPLVGRHVTDFRAPADVDRAERETRLWLRGELTHLECETELISGSGERLWADVCLDVVTASSGRRFFLGQLRDITVERRQNRELLEGDIRHRQLMDNLPESSVVMVDRELRVTLAAGEALIAAGYEPADLVGRQLGDVLPRRAWERLEPFYTQMLAGRSIDFEYDSPIDGRQYRVRVRPVTEADARVMGGLVVSEDVSADRARQSQLKQVQELAALGSCLFDRVLGWTFDAELAELWGITDGTDFAGMPLTLIPPGERSAISAQWSKILEVPGRHALRYRIRHGRTGRTVHLQSTHETVTDPDGLLTRVVSSHVDVTEAVLAAERGEQHRAEAAEQRLVLLRGVTDSMATSKLGPEKMMAGIAELAATAVGDGAAIRILCPDLMTIERDIVAHPDEAARRRFAAALRRSAGWPVPDDGIPGEVVGKGRLLSRLRPDGWRPGFAEMFTQRIFADAQDFMIAPIRHNGTVLGMLAVVRTDPDRPYRRGDDDVLQVLADGAGAAIAETRLSRQHHGLLEELAGMETRERLLLAEGIHDEPIQHLTAGIMRLDHLSTRVDPATRDELDRVAGQLEITADWLRNLIMVALNPPELAAGLGPALASLAHGIFADTPTVLSTVGPDHVRLTVPAKETAYRIFREALLNVRRHAKATTVTLRVDEHQDVVVLSLSDNGIGCADLDRAPHLGIDAMRARALADGGELNIESIQGLGTTVTLTLPTKVTQPAGDLPVVDAGAPADKAAERKHSIVICDDQQEIRSAVALMLTDAPNMHVVEDAVDGASCLKRVREFHPDVLIMDFSMPGGGPHLVRAVKRIRPDMHVIVFSGRQDARTRDAMLDAGANQFVVKTGRLRHLRDAIDRACGATSHSPGR